MKVYFIGGKGDDSCKLLTEMVNAAGFVLVESPEDALSEDDYLSCYDRVDFLKSDSAKESEGVLKSFLGADACVYFPSEGVEGAESALVAGMALSSGVKMVTAYNRYSPCTSLLCPANPLWDSDPLSLAHKIFIELGNIKPSSCNQEFQDDDPETLSVELLANLVAWRIIGGVVSDSDVGSVIVHGKNDLRICVQVNGLGRRYLMRNGSFVRTLDLVREIESMAFDMGELSYSEGLRDFVKMNQPITEKVDSSEFLERNNEDICEEISEIQSKAFDFLQYGKG